MKLIKILKKNLVPIVLVALAVGILIYMTQRKEGFDNIFDTKCTITKPLGPLGHCLYLKDKAYSVVNKQCVKNGRYKCPPNTPANGHSTIISGQCVTCPVGLTLAGYIGAMCKDKDGIKPPVKSTVTPATCS